jgi:hypothetical protein
MKSEVVYASRIRVERAKGPYRRAYLPAEERPISFGVHSEVAKHYKTDLTVHEPHATTLDYLVAAATG